MITELWKRLGRSTPKFFKKIRAIAVAVASLSTLIVTSGLAIPDTYLFIIGQTGMIAGVVAGFVASLAVEDRSDIK